MLLTEYTKVMLDSKMIDAKSVEIRWEADLSMPICKLLILKETDTDEAIAFEYVDAYVKDIRVEKQSMMDMKRKKDPEPYKTMIVCMRRESE